jgi:hypothetical protein
MRPGGLLRREDLMNTVDSGSARSVREKLQRVRRHRGAAGLLIAVCALVVVGATAPWSALLDQVATPAPAFTLAWNETSVIGAHATAGGYSLVLDRAYADANQVIVGISVVPESTGRGAVSLGRTTLVDEAGNELHLFLARGVEDSGVGASVLAFEPAPNAPAARSYTLTVDSLVAGSDAVHGPWAFTFELPTRQGTVAKPEAVSEAVRGVTVKVNELRFSATSITGTLTVSGLPAGQQWAPIGRLVNGLTAYEIVRSRPLDPVGATVAVAFETASGSGDSSGRWRLVVDEIVGHDGDEQIRLAGPWEVQFSVN